jgi:hypothetical protein
MENTMVRIILNNRFEIFTIISLLLVVVTGTSEIITNGFTVLFFSMVSLLIWISISFVQARYIKIIRERLKTYKGSLDNIAESADKFMNSVNQIKESHIRFGRPPRLEYGKKKEEVYH